MEYPLKKTPLNTEDSVINNGSLSIPRHNNSNSSTSNIPESDMESAELIPYMSVSDPAQGRYSSKRTEHTNNEKHPEGLLGILNFRQEIRGQSKRQRDLRRLVEVGFENVFVEDQEAFKHLQLVLVRHAAAEAVRELGVGEGCGSLQALVPERLRHERGAARQKNEYTIGKKEKIG